MSTPVYHLSTFLILQRVGTYDPVLSSVFNIKFAPKTNNCRKIYDVNTVHLLNTEYLLPGVVLILYVTLQSTHIYIISFDHHRIL